MEVAKKRESLEFASHLEKKPIYRYTNTNASRIFQVDERQIRFFSHVFVANRFEMSAASLRRCVTSGRFPLPIFLTLKNSLYYCFDEILYFEKAFASLLLNTMSPDGKYLSFVSSGFSEMVWDRSRLLYDQIDTVAGREALEPAIDVNQAVDILNEQRRAADWRRVATRGGPGGVIRGAHKTIKTVDEWFEQNK